MISPIEYLAMPYSPVGVDPQDAEYRASGKELMESRFKLANIVTAVLMFNGHVIFSPISHSHPIHLHQDNCGLTQNTHDFWVHGQDLPIVRVCKRVIVLDADWWVNDEVKRSVGLNLEIEEARKYGIPVRYLHITREPRINLDRVSQVLYLDMWDSPRYLVGTLTHASKRLEHVSTINTTFKLL